MCRMTTSEPNPPEINHPRLPKVDLHVHQEWSPRLDRVLARRDGRPSYDWSAWMRQLIADVPPGTPRLERLASVFPAPSEADTVDEHFVARVEDLLVEAAADDAILTEVRFGSETVLRPRFLELFREAERRVRAQYPRFHAEAVVILLLWYEPEQVERLLRACEQAARQGLAGIDLLYRPYDREADWRLAYRVARRAVEAGLGITVHAGEFSPANLEAALRVPGVTRLGHAVYARDDPRLLDHIQRRGITIECCLSCNVVLGAVRSIEEHPIRQFTEHGIPVALGSDNPVQLRTTIGREYAVASSLGFTRAELLALTRNAVRAAFTTAGRREALLAELDRADADAFPG
jgi:adenosine deaminase